MHPWWRKVLLLAGALLVVSSGVHAGRWELVKAQIARKFPDVPNITTAQLGELLKQKSTATHPLLLDVRTAPEFEVSHLPGARHVEPKSAPAAARLPAQKDAPIVTYCSVGYRSAEFAQTLRAAGFTNVRNLEGSIFQWANEDRPLIRNGQPAATVHPYGGFWSSLVKKERRAEVR